MAGTEDVEGLVELAVEAEDEETFAEAETELADLNAQLEKLNSVVCSRVTKTKTMRTLIYNQVLAVLKRKTGVTCCCACTYVGGSKRL